ncbi:ATP-binding protein [Rummeliibacillus sp. TYF005]|uniref:AAA family ATPase n=1 Tax=unclassified Rummeliibacillus TaxID=2622809 RepID=UPI000E675C11|nr:MULTISPECIES: AAA family ATPase [unclassified Rummeliibacillus]RIJ67099.1 ATP-binding protein [Rummeliibacillus sp. POC4]RPJ96164.1 ATP-binding protein [Rummeliibacillus sp. TYF005]
MFFIQMSGFPGSGKSTLALEIANRTNCIIIDHDVTKSALLHSINEDEINGKPLGGIAYNIDFALVDFYLSQGRNVILDSPCLYDELIDKGTIITQKYNANYKYIECYLDDFVEINRRLKTRNKMVSQISEVKSLETFNRTLKSSKRPLNCKCFSVNSGKSLDTYINEVIDYINS